MESNNYHVSHYEDILLHFLCENPREECFFGQCENCPTNDQMSKKISAVFKKNGVKNITHKLVVGYETNNKFGKNNNNYR